MPFVVMICGSAGRFLGGFAVGRHRPALTGKAGWLEGPPYPQPHGPTAVPAGRRLGLGSVPHTLSSSVRLDWLPNGDLRAAAPETRRELQGLIGPVLQTSQSMT